MKVGKLVVKTYKMRLTKILLISYFFSGYILTDATSQVRTAWDDTKLGDWPEECEEIAITSSVDGTTQPAIFYKSTGTQPNPLVVSLHTWSGGYDQKDTLAWQCISNNYNYIHPHFRGPNNTFEACGSPLAISDIEDAIAYAIDNSNADTNNIHIVGVSGGGYATLLAYMNCKHPVRSFSAWVPLSNLIDWYYESEGRRNKYGRDIAQATTGKSFTKTYYFDPTEARKRSPIFMTTPIEDRVNSKLLLFAGVHDGYTGSVPVTHSINFYNKIVKDYDSHESEFLVKTDEIIQLLTYRGTPDLKKDSLENRAIHYRNSYDDKIQIILFEGSHEMLSNIALDPVRGKNILAIGDSNGEFKFGWVSQLQKLRFNDVIYNASTAGNTIGFNNLGDTRKNTLHHIDQYIEEAYGQAGNLGAIIVMLGTNDCKAVFADSLELVPKNMGTLIQKIREHPLCIQSNPRIFIVSPPPIGSDSMVEEKYYGSKQRMEILQDQLKIVAERENCIFIDCYHEIKGKFSILTNDGIHLTMEGQKIIADNIHRRLD